MLKKLIQKLANMGDHSANISSGSRFVELNEETFKYIHEVIDQRAVHKGVVPRQDNFRDFELVGESFYVENIKKLAAGGPGEDAGWFSGFLICEPSNAYDRNAVAVYLIDLSNSRFEAEQVGYLTREDAASVNSAIMNSLATRGEFVPLLGRIFGGETGKENYGVSARVFWDFK